MPLWHFSLYLDTHFFCSHVIVIVTDMFTEESRTICCCSSSWFGGGRRKQRVAALGALGLKNSRRPLAPEATSAVEGSRSSRVDVGVVIEAVVRRRLRRDGPTILVGGDGRAVPVSVVRSKGPLGGPSDLSRPVSRRILRGAGRRGQRPDNHEDAHGASPCLRWILSRIILNKTHPTKTLVQ